MYSYLQGTSSHSSRHGADENGTIATDSSKRLASPSWYTGSSVPQSKPLATLNRKPTSEASAGGRREAHALNFKLPVPTEDEETAPSSRESNWQYQIHARAKQAWSGSMQNLPKLKVNMDGTYMKHTPWSDGWLDARARIKAWLEYQTM
jgi:hypothetical protein